MQQQLTALDPETVDEQTLETFLQRLKSGALHRLYSFYEDVADLKKTMENQTIPEHMSAEPELPAVQLDRARAGYNRYAAAVGGLNHLGNPMPAFDELPPKIIAAWVAALTIPKT